MTAQKFEIDKQPSTPDWHSAANRFLWVLPAWLLASAVIRMGELLGSGTLSGHLLLAAIGLDFFDFLRWLPLLLLSAWPFLRANRAWPLAIAWSILLLAQMGLSSYFLVSRTPLGSDLFAYSLNEIITTVRGADVPVRIGQIFLGFVAWLILWIGLAIAWRIPQKLGQRTVLLLPCLALATWFIPLQGRLLQGMDLDTQLRAQGKPGFFLQSVAHMWQPQSPPISVATASNTPTSQEPLAQIIDPDYPFMHPDTSRDVLGPYFSIARRPPSFVFILVEGLGRDFSGPNARQGSFTPFLDSLANRSLYFDNFIAPQGRTFGLLPSLFGSLPFGDRGFSDMGEKMPVHEDLFSLLQVNGYDARFYCGTDLEFDNERIYLQRQGIKKLRDLVHYQRSYKLPEKNTSWGFPDAELVRFVLTDEAKEKNTPSIVAIQTISMHTDYRFPDQERYKNRVIERLRELEIPESRWQSYIENINIFSAILYTDDALRQLFEGLQSLPSHEDTVYIVTGDHRLPELPMSDVLERHHVPLLIYSPLLKAPARIRAVSSQFDVAPSLLAWLSHTYGLRTPARTAWIGKGLDMHTEHRNLKDIPIKPVKGETPSFLSGDWYLLRGQVYRVSSQLTAEATVDEQAYDKLQAKLNIFNLYNQQLQSTLRLLPPDAIGELTAWNDAARNTTSKIIADTPPQLLVRDVHIDGTRINATFVNTGGLPSQSFVPLLVITDKSGNDLGEVSGQALKLGARGIQTMELNLPKHMFGNNRYLAIIPTDPDTGKKVGEGVFHVALEIP